MVHHPSSNTNPIINQPETAPPKHRPIACVDMCGEHGKQQVVDIPHSKALWKCHGNFYIAMGKFSVFP
jgi:hypothetical protein